MLIPWGSALGQRHVQIFLLFLCILVNYVGRFNAGVAVVAMTNAASTNPDFEEYGWTKLEKSYILSAFFWGCVSTQFLGGYLCRRFGAKKTMFISTFGSSLFAFAVPFCVGWGGWAVYCGIRLMQGLFQGFMFPCVHANLASWCPVNERNRLGALANTGMECGTVLSIFLSGTLASSSMGWPGIFYVTGGMGMIWCFLWACFAANTPAESKLISATELSYIQSSMQAIKPTKTEEVDTKGKIPIPWSAILTSWAFWALLVARAAHSWGFATLQAELPSFMKGVMHMDMKKNTLYSALPYLTMWCMSYVYLIASDILLNRGILSLTAIRKIFNTLAFWVPAVGLILVGFVGEEQRTLAIVLMTVNVGFNAGSTIGSCLNTIDLSPNHAGILMAIVNTAANIVPILTPLLVGLIVTAEEDRSQWQIVFAISAAVFGAGNLFYVIFGRMTLQPWDDPDFMLKSKIGNVEDDTKPNESYKKNNSNESYKKNNSTKQSIEVPL